MTVHVRLMVLAATLALVGCRTTASGAQRPDTDVEEATFGEGLASFYANKLEGNLTANGGRYDPKAFTAAHRRLAFGTCVKVTRVDDGREVEVTITDRGPFVKGRIIDLSRAAAEVLGFIAEGTVRVRLAAC